MPFADFTQLAEFRLGVQTWVINERLHAFRCYSSSKINWPWRHFRCRQAGGPGTAMRVSETFGASAHVVRGVPLIDYLLPHQHSHDATNLSTKDEDKVRANELI